MISLKNKVTIITGGSRGIGAATALLFARAGSDIVLNYIKNDAKAEAVANCVRSFGRNIVLHKGDVADSRTANELIEQAVTSFKRFDIVVNNAGIWTHGEIGDMSEDIWDETIDTNLKSVFNVCNAAIPHLKRSKGGWIVNIASTAGQRGEAFHAHYAASKGGILAFTRSLAVEVAPFGIRVNAVAPGWVDTEMNEEVFADKQFRADAVEGIPLKRIATAEDIAGPVLFLASDFARHITGATINVNGGSVLS
jgi:3-oxoacyl-[acyl-carrier protein] reductase